MSSTMEAFGRRWKRVWAEDECTRHGPASEGHEYVSGAWKRLFGEEYQRAMMQDAQEDWGDATAVRIGERVVVSSFDGDSIYVPVKCSECWDGGWLCGECGKPECECAMSYCHAPPYPCECPAGQAKKAEALASRDL